MSEKSPTSDNKDKHKEGKGWKVRENWGKKDKKRVRY